VILSNRRLRCWFTNYNRRYFGGRLPAHTKLSFAPVERCLGLAYGGDDPRIVLDPICCICATVAQLTLLHEMVHLERYPLITHGAGFDRRMQELAAAGAMKGLL
jgi:hypothetical protein